jgi:CHASE2 domain-containing sensor protein
MKKAKRKKNTEKGMQMSRLIPQKTLLPGLTVIGLVLLARLIGLFQGLELRTLDGFLRLRPAEPQDERILIVGINEPDIQQVGKYPIPDQVLAELLKSLSKNNPRAIGLDIVRDLPVEPGHQVFRETLKTLPNIIGIERISSDLFSPHTLPPEQIGFVDFPLDPDGFLRHSYLGAQPEADHPNGDEFRFSFAFLLAEIYLEKEGIFVEPGRQDPDNMRFGETELFSLQPNSGGYVRMKLGGVQTLINVRSGSAPFEIVSMSDVLSGRVTKDLIEDRVVLVGITAPSVKDFISSGAVNITNPGLVRGVEMHAHIVSQLLSNVLDNRPAIRVWPDGWEYVWIAIIGALGMLLPRLMLRPIWYVLLVSLTGCGLIGMGLLMLWLSGWWIPVIPSLVVFALNSGILPVFYLYDQALRSRIDERQRVIEQTYDTIHSGPLQTLALLLQNQETLEPHIGRQLETLNGELRKVYDRLLKESVPLETQLLLGDSCAIDLRNPLHEVLYEVYVETLNRNFPGFRNVKLKVVKFEPLQVTGLSNNDKQAICRFLEEALCNVGKHAVGARRLTVHCLATSAENLIRVEDNSSVDVKITDASSDRRGTQQAKILAQRLQGSFQRTSLQSGTCCELRWPLQPLKTAQHPLLNYSRFSLFIAKILGKLHS